MPKKVDVLDVFKPAELNLYDLVGFVKAHLNGLINSTYSEKGLEWGRAYTSELIQRLLEIQRKIPRAKNIAEMRLDLALVIALHKTVIESAFVTTDDCQLLSQLRFAIGKVLRSFHEFLKNPVKAKRRRQKLKVFCDELYRKLPFEERFRPGRVPPAPIRIPKERCHCRTNYMADGQPGEAD